MKALKYISVAVLSVVLVTGCSTGQAAGAVPGTDTQNQAEESNEGASPEGKVSTSEEAPAVRAVEDGQQNMMVIGKIVKIYGNYIQVNKVEMPEGFGSRTRDISNASGGETTKTNLATAMSSGSGMRPGGGMPPGAGRWGNSSTENYEYSGELISIMIPVGSEITQMSDDTLELTYDSLKKGQVVRIRMDMEMTNEFQDTTEEETYYADSVIVVE